MLYIPIAYFETNNLMCKVKILKKSIKFDIFETTYLNSLIET